MGEKYPILKPREVVKALETFGFVFRSQRGSHAKYVSDGEPKRVVIIPMHDVIARGTLKSILLQAGIELDEFLKKVK